jgi:tetratricopeptide (TPR) repeat protein
MKGLVAAVIVAAWCATAHAQGAGSGSGSGEENELPPELAPKPHVDAPTPAPAPAPGADADEHPAQSPPPAPDDPKTKAEARKLIDGGDTFLKKGDYLDKHGHHDQAVEQYQRALAAYQKAYELVQNPQVYFAIAGAEQRLGHWLDAAEHYKKVLTDVPDLKPALKDAATAQLDAVKANLGQITLTVSPDGTHVTVDGKDVGTSPLADPLLLVPGEYTLGFAHDGFSPTEQKLKVEAGSESERTFTLKPLPVVVEKPREAPPPPPPPPTLPKLPLYVGAGATGAFAVSAIITGIVAVKKHSTFANTQKDEATREAARTSGKHYALACDLSIGGALLAGGFTAYWYVKHYKPAQRELEQQPPSGDAEPAAWWVAPVLSTDGGGVAVGGRF